MIKQIIIQLSPPYRFFLAFRFVVFAKNFTVSGNFASVLLINLSSRKNMVMGLGQENMGLQ